MSHDPHHVQPGYSPEQVLHDGCTECDRRAARDDHGIDTFDMATFERAWKRAATWQREGLPNMAHNELPAFSALVSVMIQFERRGLPYGWLPSLSWAPTNVEAVAPGLLDAYGETGGTE